MRRASACVTSVEPGEFGVTQPITLRTFHKFYLSGKLRRQPDTFLHLLGVQAFAPSRFTLLRQFCERAVVHNQGLQLFIHLAPDRWHKSRPHLGDVHQLILALFANDDRINTMGSGYKATNNASLPKVLFLDRETEG